MFYSADEESCRKIFEEMEFDAVVTDHNIPGTDGYKILHYVKSRRPDCPVIMCTGTGTEEIAARGFSENLDAYIQKRNYRQLPAVLKKVLDQAQVRSDLRSTKERLERLVSASPAVIYSARIDGGFQVLFVSANVETQLGFSPADYLNDAEFRMSHIHPDDRERLNSAVARALKTGFGTAEYRFKAADESYRWIRDEFRISADGAGKATEIAGYWIDITGQKQASETAEQLLAIIDASPEGIAMTETGRVQFMNPAARRLLGIGPEEDVTARHLLDFREPEMREFMNGTVLPTAVRDGLWSGETVYVSRDGRRVPVSQVVIAHKNAGGAIAFYSTIFRDISEQKEMEARLRHAQKMQAIHRLAGGMAHDFNNLLTVVLGYADMLVAELGPGHPMRHRIQAIGAAARRGGGLTRQLLAVSRRQPMRFRVVDLSKSVEGMKDMLQRLIGEDVGLTVHADELPALVRVDTSQMEQVILNLAVNARDAMPNGGRLDVSTRRLPENEKAGKSVRLTVSDTGDGMSPETQEHIFEPFFTTKGEQGTGLWLALVYGIVDQSGGEIRVRSAIGKGTTFEIDLPAAPAGTAELENGEAEAPARQAASEVTWGHDDAPVSGRLSLNSRKWPLSPQGQNCPNCGFGSAGNT